MDEYGEDILGAVDKTKALVAEFDALILLDAIADEMLANATNEDETFQAEVLNHAIKEIRKNRGMDQ